MANELNKASGAISKLVDRHGPLTVITFMLLISVLFGSYSQQERIITALQVISGTQQVIAAQLEKLASRIEALERREGSR